MPEAIPRSRGPQAIGRRGDAHFSLTVETGRGVNVEPAA